MNRDEFGLVHILAETGCRENQAWRLEVGSLLDDPVKPQPAMPTSRKGSNRLKRRKAETRPLSISLRLAALLRQRARGARRASISQQTLKLAARRSETPGRLARP